MGTSEIHFGGLFKNTSSFLYWPGRRKRMLKKIIKVNPDMNKTNNRQARNRITKSDWGSQKF